MSRGRPHRVTLIPGDGIGPDVVTASRRVLEATGVPIEWDVRQAGAEEHARSGNPLPRSTLESIDERRVALKGPTATPVGGGFRSVNLLLRRTFDLFAGIRPARAYEGVREAVPGTDVVVVRMNHQDLYAGIEYAPDRAEASEIRSIVKRSHDVELEADSGISLKYISSSEAERLVRTAFEYARDDGRRRVTVVHKATVMRATDGLFLKAAKRVAMDFSDIDLDDELVDTICGNLARRGGADREVLVSPTMYGDILSDITAGLVGGLGLAPGGNIGPRHAVFEAVHGSAPRHAGRNRANPMAAVLSGAMLLRHVRETEAAARVEEAVAAVLRDGRQVTYDLASGSVAAASTTDVTEAIISALGDRPTD